MRLWRSHGLIRLPCAGGDRNRTNKTCRKKNEKRRKETRWSPHDRPPRRRRFGCEQYGIRGKQLANRANPSRSRLSACVFFISDLPLGSLQGNSTNGRLARLPGITTLMLRSEAQQEGSIKKTHAESLLLDGFARFANCFPR